MQGQVLCVPLPVVAKEWEEDVDEECVERCGYDGGEDEGFEDVEEAHGVVALEESAVISNVKPCLDPKSEYR